MSSPPWDEGLQNERTGLAWQRTVLAGLAAGLLVARLLADASLLLAVLTGLGALLGTAALGWVALRRFRIQSDALQAAEPLADGRPQLLVSAVVVVTALGALLFALTA